MQVEPRPGGALARVRAPVSARLEEKRSTRDAEMAGGRGGGATRLFTLGKRGTVNPRRLRDPRRTRNRYTRDVGGTLAQPRLTGITLGKDRRNDLSFSSLHLLRRSRFRLLPVPQLFVRSLSCASAHLPVRSLP